MCEASNDRASSADPRLTRLGPRRRRIVGDLDAFTALAIEPAIRRLIDTQPVIVLDLSGIHVLTAGGLEMLERVHAYADGLGRSLVMLAPQEGLVHEVLRFSRLPEDAIMVEPDAAASRPVPGD
ncbi:MAG: STAS domain-containing protein [Egibacteraceae bacterium]